MSYGRQEFLRMEKLRNRRNNRRPLIHWVSRIFIALIALFIAYGIGLQLLGLM